MTEIKIQTAGYKALKAFHDMVAKGKKQRLPIGEEKTSSEREDYAGNYLVLENGVLGSNGGGVEMKKGQKFQHNGEIVCLFDDGTVETIKLGAIKKALDNKLIEKIP